MVLPPTESGAASIDRTPAAASVTRSACPFAGRSARRPRRTTRPCRISSAQARSSSTSYDVASGEPGSSSETWVTRSWLVWDENWTSAARSTRKSSSTRLSQRPISSSTRSGSTLTKSAESSPDEPLEPEPLVEGALRPRLPPRREHERHDQGALDEDDDAGVDPGRQEGQHGPQRNRSHHPV